MSFEATETSVFPTISDAERDSPDGNLILANGELLFSTVERVQELRRQITILNQSISDAYEEARKADLPIAEIKWLLVQEALPPAVLEQRDERDAKRAQVQATYRAMKARRDAEAAAKAARAHQ
jgi:predicted phage gp36 major capsid-like protein